MSGRMPAHWCAKNPVAAAQPGKVPEEVLRGNVDAPAALDALHDDAGDIAQGELRLHGRGVIELAEPYLVVRVERGDDRGVVRQRHGARGAPVETPAESDDAVLAGMERGQLGGVLVRLRAAVVQEQRVVFITGGLADAARELLLERVAHAVGIESDLVQLRLERLHVVRMAVADGE